MITITGFVLLFAALYSVIRLILFSFVSSSYYYISLAAGAFSLAVGITGLELESFTSFFNSSLVWDWSRVATASFLLSGMSILLWMSKPAFARFPMMFCSLPLLLIPTFPLIIDSPVIKEMIIALFQGGAIAIGIMLYSLRAIQNNKNYYVVGGISLILLSFLLYWIPANILAIPIWIIKLMLAISLPLIIQGFAKHIKRENMKPAEIV